MEISNAILKRLRADTGLVELHSDDTYPHIWIRAEGRTGVYFYQVNNMSAWKVSVHWISSQHHHLDAALKTFIKEVQKHER